MKCLFKRESVWVTDVVFVSLFSVDDEVDVLTRYVRVVLSGFNEIEASSVKCFCEVVKTKKKLRKFVSGQSRGLLVRLAL